MSSQATSGQVIGPDLSCLLDCFPDESDPGYCITTLVRDVISGGTCNIAGNPGTWGITDGCTIEEATCITEPFPAGCTFIDTIRSGTCSAETEGLLALDECVKSIQEQSGLIINMLKTIIQYSSVFNPFAFLPRIGQSSRQRLQKITPTRLAPVQW